MDRIEPFAADFNGVDLIYGRDCVRQDVGSMLDDLGSSRALVVCGSNVGANSGVMGPVRDGLQDRCVGVFDETSSAKSIETIYDGINEMTSNGVDVLIGVGSGSSLNAVRMMSGLEADGRSLEELRREFADTGSVANARFGGQPTPFLTIPTTFAGADLTRSSSVVVSDSDAFQPGGANRVLAAAGSLLPQASFYDPNLFATTPTRLLAGSAMNGFNKGVESVYSRHANPVSDTAALHGIRLMKSGLHREIDRAASPGIQQAAVGCMLVQLYRNTSIIHAFGHAISRRYPVQQGVAHGIIAPHVLQYLFNNVDGRRRFLGIGVGLDVRSMTDSDLGLRIVDEVTALRDALGVPTGLRSIEGFDRDDFDLIARYVSEDPPMAKAPVNLSHTPADLKEILEAAW